MFVFVFDFFFVFFFVFVFFFCETGWCPSSLLGSAVKKMFLMQYLKPYMCVGKDAPKSNVVIDLQRSMSLDNWNEKFSSTFHDFLTAKEKEISCECFVRVLDFEGDVGDFDEHTVQSKFWEFALQSDLCRTLNKLNIKLCVIFNLNRTGCFCYQLDNFRSKLESYKYVDFVSVVLEFCHHSRVCLLSTDYLEQLMIFYQFETLKHLNICFPDKKEDEIKNKQNTNNMTVFNLKETCHNFDKHIVESNLIEPWPKTTAFSFICGINICKLLHRNLDVVDFYNVFWLLNQLDQPFFIKHDKYQFNSTPCEFFMGAFLFEPQGKLELKNSFVTTNEADETPSLDMLEKCHEKINTLAQKINVHLKLLY